MVIFLTSLTAAIVLIALGLLHVYWAIGGYFPGKDASSLAQTVVGGQADMNMPSALACLLVASLLFIAAWVVLVVGGITLPVLSLELHTQAAYGLCAVLFLRGIVGFFDARLRPEIKGSPYEKLNLTLYSPLCLTLAALVLATVWNA